MSSEISQLMSYSLEAPRPTLIPCGFDIVSQELSRYEFCKSFRAEHIESECEYLAKVIQLPLNFDYSTYFALLESQNLSFTHLKWSLPYSYVIQANSQVTMFRPMLPHILSYKLSGNKEYFMYEMIRAVNEVHKSGLVHANIKLSNFIITMQDEVFLVDHMICKPLYVEDELEMQFLNFESQSRIASNQEFQCCDQITDICELGYACYDLFYGNVNSNMIFTQEFEFSSQFDEPSENNKLSINSAIKELISGEYVDENDIFSSTTLKQLSTLRLYLPGSLYSNIQFLLKIGGFYLDKKDAEGYVTICCHLIELILDRQLLNEVEKSVLLYFEQCFAISCNDVQNQLLNFLYILIEKPVMCQNNNYLLFFAKVLESITDISDENYYFPFIITCRFYVQNNIEKIIPQFLKQLREQRYFDVITQLVSTNEQRFESKIDDFYLVNCFPGMFEKIIGLAAKDAEFVTVIEDLFITNEYSFLSTILQKCHQQIEDNGASQLLASLLTEMVEQSTNDQIFISRIITLLNCRQSDIVAAFLQHSGNSKQYLISVEQLILEQCENKNFDIEQIELFQHRINLKFSDDGELLLKLLEYIANQLTKGFFCLRDSEQYVRTKTISFYCYLCNQYLQYDKIIGTLRINKIFYELYDLRLKQELQFFFKTNCGFEFSSLDEVGSKMQQLCSDIERLGKEYNINILFDEFKSQFLEFEILLSYQIEDQDYLFSFLTRLQEESNSFIDACQQLVKLSINKEEEQYTMEFNVENRVPAHIEAQIYSVIKLPVYLEQQLEVYQYNNPNLEYELLFELIGNSSLDLGKLLENSELSSFILSECVNQLACNFVPECSSSYNEALQKMKLICQNSRQLLEKSPNSLVQSNALYSIFLEEVQEFTLSLQSSKINIMKPEMSISELTGIEQWSVYREIIENQILEQKIFMQMQDEILGSAIPPLKQFKHLIQNKWYINANSYIKQVEVIEDYIFALTDLNVFLIFKLSEVEVSQDILKFIFMARNITNIKIFEEKLINSNKNIENWQSQSSNDIQQYLLKKFYDQPLFYLPFPFPIKMFECNEKEIYFLTVDSLLKVSYDIAKMNLHFLNSKQQEPVAADKIEYSIQDNKQSKINLYISNSEENAELVQYREENDLSIVLNQLLFDYSGSQEERNERIFNISTLENQFIPMQHDLQQYFEQQLYFAGKCEGACKLEPFELFAIQQIIPMQIQTYYIRGNVVYCQSKHHLYAYFNELPLKTVEFRQPISFVSYQQESIFLCCQNELRIFDYELVQVKNVLFNTGISQLYSFTFPELQHYAKINEIESSTKFIAVFTRQQVIIYDTNFNQILLVCVEECEPSAFLALKNELFIGFSQAILLKIDFCNNMPNCEILQQSGISVNSSAALTQGEVRRGDISIQQQEVYVKCERQQFQRGRIVALKKYKLGFLSVNEDGNVELWK